MGEVYLATDSVLARPVAVKVLAEHQSRDAEIRARFEREALAAARLSHERYVVTVFDVGEHEGRPYIVMEYVDGGSVHDRLAQGPIPREQALTWLEQVGQALDRAHASGIVHRDVKPANVLLDSEGSVRVSDFGIASAAGLDTMTLPGTILGTAGYLSPEQARGEPATPASDRYALGVIAFELLTGTRPFAGDTPATQAFAHVNAPVPSAAGVAPELPRGVDRVLARALAKNPADRPASCAELVAELRDALEPIGPETEEATLAAAAAAGRRSVTAPTAATKVLPPGASRPTTRVDSGGTRQAVLSLLVSRIAASTEAARRLVETLRRRPRATAVALASTTLLAALAVTLLVGAADGDQRAPERAPATAERSGEQTIADQDADGAALNAQGFELMQAGRFEEALPILREAVGALRGSGTLDEAYASYNLAFTRFALGRCDGVTGLLDRSERVQGERSEIDALRAEWRARCAAPVVDEDDADADDNDAEARGAPPKGKGKGRGGGRDD